MSENNDPPLNATALLRIVVSMLASEYPSRVQVQSLINRLALQDGVLQINVIQGLLNLIRALPTYIFRSDDDRLATISALREVLDGAIEEEEGANEDLPLAAPPSQQPTLH